MRVACVRFALFGLLGSVNVLAENMDWLDGTVKDNV